MADTRTCIGSAKLGIERHEAPVTDFPVQPSQRDGFGRMCRPHWTAYTRALRKAANGGAAGEVDREVKPSLVPTVTPAIQSQAATRVATKRAARVTATESDGAMIQKALLDKVRANGGSIPAEAPAPELTRTPGRRSKAPKAEVTTD